MQARVEQFHTDAQRPPDKKTCKDIDKLRKFLFKNQEYSFTDREQSHLFSAVQLYATAFAAASQDDNPALPLLEDALKMPFNVFSTSQKKKMLKWLYKAQGKEADVEGASTHVADVARYQVIDVCGGVATLMQDDGDCLEYALDSVDGSLAAQLKERFDKGDEICVCVEGGILKILS